MDNLILILSTKRLTEKHELELTSKGYCLEHYDILEAKPLINDKIKTRKNVILTSFKGTQFALNIIENPKGLSFFVVGNKSKNLLESEGLRVNAHSNYSEDLANIISDEFSNLQFDYLCSPDRLGYLPSILSSNQIYFNEIHTYKTEINNQVSRNVGVYLWFSPKGFDAYDFSEEMKNAKHICIGKTTAKEVAKKIHKNNILFPEIPSIDNMIGLLEDLNETVII